MEKPLGAVWEETCTRFRLFAPRKSQAEVLLYHEKKGKPYQKIRMKKNDEGYFCARADGNLHGVYYTYLVDGREILDPYAKACSANGARGFIFDGKTTQPQGWEQDDFIPQTPIVWEVHIRDFSVDEWLNAPKRGTFSAFQTGMKTPDGKTALVDYLKELGITYVQLLPVCDFASVDELTGGYNWGYDPASYFIPEGSYSSDAENPLARIRELKELVKTLHDNGIGVIMDVVYNHVYDVEQNPLGVCAKEECFRMENGELCNGSGCGNETRSERPFFRRLMIDSVCYFAKEFHIDGFRFDLMGLHDVRTMNCLRQALDDLFEDGRGKRILTYGEPWYASPPHAIESANKQNLQLLSERVGAFHDGFRDGVRGSQYHAVTRGFVQGDISRLNTVMDAVLARKEQEIPFQSPMQQVLYCACHDDLTLYDHLKATINEGEDIRSMQKMAGFFLFSGLGIVFLQAGEEWGHSKGGNDNSYQAGDKVNALRWEMRSQNADLVKFYQGLIAIRKRNSAFWDMENARDSARQFPSPKGVAIYQIGDFIYAVNGTERGVCVNAEGSFSRLCDGERASATPFATDEGGFYLSPYGVYCAEFHGGELRICVQGEES